MKYFYDTEFADDGKTIHLISIGIVAEDGREYYAQSADFLEHGKANEWLQLHVIPHLNNYWTTRKTIREELLAFMDVEKYGKPELWGYYSAYDHVAFCQLFGTMMDLPKGFPMYTRDLKQWCDTLGVEHLPKQKEDEHHALADAKWNRQVWEYLNYLESLFEAN